MIVYLAGPIANCDDAECKDWRNYAVENLVCETLNPMVRDYRVDIPESAADVVEPDKADILKSDVVLVNYTRPSVGTSMEVIFSWMEGKKVLLIAPPKEAISPWLTYHSHARFDSVEQAVGFINLVLLMAEEAIEKNKHGILG